MSLFGLAVIILVGTYFSIPFIARQALLTVSTSLQANISGTTLPIERQVFYFAMGMFVFGLSAISFACYLLGRSAFRELEIGARSICLADALCIAHGNLEAFEKAANLFIPKGKHFISPDVLSQKERETLLELLKRLSKVT